MKELLLETSIHWIAVIVYIAATIANAIGLIFRKPRIESASYIVVLFGLLVHGGALALRWIASGHGPYMVRYEILSSNAWVALATFLVFSRLYPRIKPASIVVFPASFLMIALGLFFNPAIRRLPPSLSGIWLVLHIGFYKIALATMIIALAFSVLYLWKKHRPAPWLDVFPDPETMDRFAYRFAGFGFTFWAIGMLAGSIWAYHAWGSFWSWDPVETWALLTWLAFGVYLHLRRFFGWKDERAAYLYIACFGLALLTIFGTSLIEVSLHSEYFR